MLNLNNNNHKEFGNAYYLQYIGEAEVQEFSTLEEVEAELRQKLETAKADNFYGFLLSMRKDMACGVNKFGSEFPTWYTTGVRDSKHFVNYELPKIQYKLKHFLIVDCLTDGEIEKEFSHIEQLAIIRHNKYGAFALR